jgi:hypothetical protein
MVILGAAQVMRGKTQLGVAASPSTILSTNPYTILPVSKYKACVSLPTLLCTWSFSHMLSIHKSLGVSMWLTMYFKIDVVSKCYGVACCHEYFLQFRV